MDDHSRRRKQNEQEMRPPSDPRYQQPGEDASQRQYHQSNASSSERQRIVSGRVMSSSAGYGGYYQEPAQSAYSTGTSLPHGAMEYSQQTTDYTQDARQGFASNYNTPSAGMMYSVQQHGAFDATQSFGSRQHGGMQIMAADVTSTPYYSSDSTSAGVASLHAQAGQRGPSVAVYQQHTTPESRSGVAAVYGGPLASELAGGGGMLSQPVNTSNPASSVAAGPSGSQDYADTHESYVAYQRNLKDVFKNIKAGSLAPASETLLGISDWLLTRVETLGLTVDDEDLYEGRVKLWKNFNNAWLGLLEKQKEMMWSGNKLQRSQSLISFEDLQRMARELVCLCDCIECFGLVDYDYGVWEERIMAVLTECVDLYGMIEEEGASAASGPSSHRG